MSCRREGIGEPGRGSWASGRSQRKAAKANVAKIFSHPPHKVNTNMLYRQIKKLAWGIPCPSSGWDSGLSQQRVWVQSLVVELRSHKPSGVAKFKKEKKKRDWLGLELDQDRDDTAGNKPGQSPQSSNSLTKPHLRHSVLPSGLRIQLPQPLQSPRAQGATRPLGALGPLFLPTHYKSTTISLSSKLAKTVKVWVIWGPASLST